MAMTIVEKILARKSMKNVVKPDSIVQVSVDLVMMHVPWGLTRNNQYRAYNGGMA